MSVECGHLPEVSSGLLREVVRKAREDRLPVAGAFDITYRCDFRCAHCYVRHLVDRPRSQANELTTGQAKELLRQMADAGCLMLMFSGGEPLLREDFVDLYVTARRLGLVVTVFTNASMITEAHLEAFREYPPRMVDVSLYGLSEEIHRRVTGVPGALPRVRRGLEQLLEAGVRVGLKTMILRDNVEEVPVVRAFARDLGIRFRLDPLVTPRLDGDPAPLAQRVDPRVAVELEFDGEEHLAQMADRLEEDRLSAFSAPRSRRLYRCGAGMASFHLDPQGMLRPCVMSRDLGYDALGMGFSDAWTAVVDAVDALTWDETDECWDCRMIPVCGYCAGLLSLEGASPSRPPEYLCRLGAARYGAIMDAQAAEVSHARQ